MDKELEALERLAMPDEMHIEECKKLGIDPTEDYDFLKQALLELKAIKEANPSEALEMVRKYESSNYLNVWHPKFIKALKTIENYILKVQEQEKIFDDNLVFENGHFMSGFSYKGKQIVAMPLNEYDRLMGQEEVLEILFEKQVDLGWLWYCIHECVDSLNEYNKKMPIEKFKLTEEEFDLLKKWSERR